MMKGYGYFEELPKKITEKYYSTADPIGISDETLGSRKGKKDEKKKISRRPYDRSPKRRQAQKFSARAA